MFNEEELEKITLVESEDGSMKVNIFDFDNTLFKSPTPNPALWNRKFAGILKNDVKDNGLGWFQSTLTLSPKYIDQNNFIESTVEEVKKSMADRNSYTVLLTGRNTGFTDLIKGLVSKKGLEFDAMGLKPVTAGKLTTLEFKFSFIKGILENLKNSNHKISEINIWEDREEHVKKITGFLKNLGIPFKVHYVTDGDWYMPEDLEKELVGILIKEHTAKNGKAKEFDMEKKPQYYALVLDGASRSKLLSSVEIPKDWKQVAHHMTIIPPPFMGKENEVMNWVKENIGKEFSVKTKAVGKTENAMAVAVDGLTSLNKVPHVTVAIPQGGSAKNSLQITEWKPMDEIELTGKVEAVY